MSHQHKKNNVIIIASPALVYFAKSAIGARIDCQQADRVLGGLNWCRGTKAYFSRLNRQLKRIKHTNLSCTVRISPPEIGETDLCSGTSHGSALGSAPFFVSGGGGVGGLLAVVSPLPQHCMLQACNPSSAQAYLCKKYEIGVEEVERRWADRVLECLINAEDEQRVVQ